MVRRNVYLSSDQYDALRTLSQALGIAGQRDKAGELPEGISPLLQALGDIAAADLQKLAQAIEAVRK